MCYHFFHLPITGPRIATLRVASLLEFPARYHVRPTEQIAVIRAVGEKSEREMVSMRWGLIPSWTKGLSDQKVMLANARGETLASKPSFRSAYKNRRCLIVADGFYEWKKLQNGKQQYSIRLKDHSMITFAGLWERWESTDQVIESCTIVTSAANAAMAELHDRMPVMLPEMHHEQWLDPLEKKVERFTPLLQPSLMELDLDPTTAARVGPSARQETQGYLF